TRRRDPRAGAHRGAGVDLRRRPEGSGPCRRAAEPGRRARIRGRARMKTIDPVSLGIMWDRLISITDEVLSALVRTSFSSNVRDSYDLSCLLFSGNGLSLAQGTYSVPSFTGTAPATLGHMLARFP